MNERLDSVRGIMCQSKLDALLVTGIENVRYLTGFTGSSAAVVVTLEDAFLVTDGRYREQATRESEWNVVIYDDTMVTTVTRLLESAALVGFEVDTTFELYRKLKEARGEMCGLEPAVGVVEGLRSRKSQGEVRLIREALHCAARAFSEVA
ncbi:MAG: aminopeptidase P family N-terminal domain-containing protein, partial [Actinobacteria bacterium]|nr:aminopeptidase P family N-terminal domain-containing protein [Actinomycetota bacterium]